MQQKKSLRDSLIQQWGAIETFHYPEYATTTKGTTNRVKTICTKKLP